MVYSSKDFNLVDFCRDSAKYASIMAFAAPKVESLWFLRPAGSKPAELERLYQAEGLPKNISIEELTFPSAVELNLLRRAKRQADYCDKHGVDYPTFDKNGTGRRIRRFILLQ